MTDIVSYSEQDGVATIRMDDGKVNCINPAMVAALDAAFERARDAGAVVVLTGRPGKLSAGFDLKVFQKSMEAAIEMVAGGGEFLTRTLQFPLPVVIASTGHAIAMGSFLTLAGDVRLGVAGDYQYGMNESAIGMTLPYFAVELARTRIAPTHLTRVAMGAEMFSPEGAVAAGFLDQVVSPDQFDGAVMATAKRLAGLNMAAYAGNKQRVNEPLVAALKEAAVRERAALGLATQA